MYLNEEQKYISLQYGIYKQFCIEHGIEPLSQDYLEVTDQESEEFKIKDDEHKTLLGKAGIAINAGMIYETAKHGFKRFRENKGDVKKTIGDLKGDAANFIGDVINDFTNGKGGDEKINPDINGGGGNFSSNKYNASSTPLGNSSALIANLNRNPVETKFETGIAPRATYQLDLYPSDAYTPLHLNIGEPTFDNLVNDQNTFDYVKNVLMFNFQNKAQAEINFNLDVNSAFSADNLVKLFNVQMYLLNSIYNVLSVTGYSSDPLNRNLGIRALRGYIDPNLINLVSQAMELIAGTPIPPNLKSLCHWFNGNYNQNSLANSPAIRFICVEPNNYSNQMNSRLLDGIGKLQALRPTSSILARIVKNDPAWYSTPHYSSEILHDQDFTTLFANASFRSGATYLPPMYDTNANFNYITFGATDGGILGMTTKRISPSGKLQGLLGFDFNGVNPVDTRWSLVPDTATGGSKFEPSFLNVNNAFTRGDIQVGYQSAVTGNPLIITPSFVRFGAEMLQQVSFASVKENERSMIRHLTSIDKIKSKDMKPKSEGKRYPSKRK